MADELRDTTAVDDSSTDDAGTAAMQTDQNIINGVAPGEDPTRESNGNEDDTMDDLFGEDDDEDAQLSRPKKRRLDDEELDSGDDLDRQDRMDEDENDNEPTTPPMQQEEISYAVAELPRQSTLRGTDGELYLLHNPIYTGIEPKAFAQKTFAPPTTAHHSNEAPGANFSPAQTANTTMRWRHSPSDMSKLQSNSRIIRWSDGSLTLQIGSVPLEQYELPATALAPPQAQPRKPTPISKPPRKGVPLRHPSSKANSHTYLATVYEQGQLGFARLTNHVTASLTVRSTRTGADEQADDALLRLQEKMAATIAAKRGTAAGGLGVVKLEEDPEEGRRRAERAEKEKARAQKMKEKRLEREEARREGILGPTARYGRSAMGGGLTVGGLEDEELGGGRSGGTRRPKAPAKKRAKRARYSDDDEEEFRKGKTREDEYDEEDDFIAPEDDDEEIEAGGDDDDEEEVLADEDADAEGEADDQLVQSVEKGDEVAAARSRRRQVVDDDEE